MFVVWNDGGAYISPFRTVLAQRAPTALAELDERYPDVVGQGNYLVPPYSDTLLELLRNAYVEAAHGPSPAEAL